MAMRRLAPALALLLALAACGGDDTDEGDVGSSSTVPPVTAPSGTPPPSDPPSSSGESSATEATPPRSFTATPLTPQVSPASTAPGFPIDPSMPIVVAAVADLASRLGVAEDTVVVVDARAVTWGDSSLGCPQPGMQYLQRTVDGVLVILEAEGRRYEYHGGDPAVPLRESQGAVRRRLTARDLQVRDPEIPSSACAVSRPSEPAVPAGSSRRCGRPSCRGRRRSAWCW